MAQRKVFGRLKFQSNGRTYRFEMKPDGIWVRELHHRSVWLVPPELILTMTKRQTELFTDEEMARCDHEFVDSHECLKCGWKPMDKGDTQPTVPDLPEGHMVPAAPGSDPVHEGGEQPPQDPPVGGDGLPPYPQRHD